MGISISHIWYLVEKGLIERNSRVLDIGASYLHNLKKTDVFRFVEKFGVVEISERAAADLCARSVQQAGKQMLFLSELLALTSIDYVSYDVCPGAKTKLFDLNRFDVLDEDRNAFDIVLNFGTSEHIVNQINTFKVMHDALKVGGVLFHQSPSIGWVDHGYFAYHPRFYRDLQIANNYQEIDLWMARTSQCEAPSIDFRDEEQPLEARSGGGMPDLLPCCNLTVLHRKTEEAPFRVSLELSTAHSGLPREIRALHVEDPVVHQTRAVDLVASLVKRGAARLGLAR